MKHVHPYSYRPALRLLAIAVASASLFASTAALSQADSYGYFGLSAGQSRSNMNTQNTVDQLLGAGLSTGLASNRRDTGYKAFGGYQFNPYVGMELGYFDLGHFSFDATTASGALGGRYKMKGVDFDLVGSLPMSERWAANARIGVQDAQTNADFSPTGTVVLTDLNRSQRDVNVKFGLGLQYAFSRSLMMRAELERFRVNDAVGRHAGVNLVSVGLVFPFGRVPLRAPQAMAAPQGDVATLAPPDPAPAAVAVAATPQPVAVIVPSRRRVSYSVESLFTFDESAIRPEGQVALDSFARELSGASYQVVTVEGHTDRLGTAEYNQALSVRRAETVKSYLVTSGGVMPDKITVVGMSESQPVTLPADCTGTVANEQLKACLQPDRRVEIEVVGTR